MQKRDRGTFGNIRFIMSFLLLGDALFCHCCDWRVYMLLSNVLNMVFFL